MLAGHLGYGCGEVRFLKEVCALLQGGFRIKEQKSKWQSRRLLATLAV
jgi:hypothetical protein